MLPTHLSRGGSGPPVFSPRLAVAAAAARRPSFLASFCHRMGHLSLMDLQFSLAQFSLLLFAPRKVYAFAVLRKKQKNHYARDDPGFLLLLLLFSLLVGLAYGLAFSHSLCGCLLTAVAPSIHLLLSGAVIAPLAYLLLLRQSNRNAGTPAQHTISKGTWTGGNKLTGGRHGSGSCAAQQQQEVPPRRDLYAQQQQPTGHFPLRLLQNAAESGAAGLSGGGVGHRANGGVAGGREKTARSGGPSNYYVGGVPAVEIFYCFDVHWNAAFVYMVVGLVMQLFLFPVFSMLPDFVACLLANSLQVAAAGSYLFITMLGYMSVTPTPPLPPLFALVRAVTVAATLVVLCATLLHINFAQASVKMLLMLESLALKPIVRDAGIAHTLLQQEAFDLFSPNSSSNALSNVSSPAVLDSAAAVTNGTGEAATANAAAAALSSAAAAVESGANRAAVPMAKGVVTRR